MPRPEHPNDQSNDWMDDNDTDHPRPTPAVDTLEPPLLAAGEDPSSKHRTGIRRVSDGVAPQIRKRGTGGVRAGIRREAEVIQAVGGTELVQFVELHDGDEFTELVMRDVGGSSLAAMLGDRATTAAAALRLLAATCETVARLHARGWGHGRLDANHVLVTARGRIRLCSLRDAAPIEVDPSIARNDRTALLRVVDDWTHSASTRSGRRPSVDGLRARMLARRTRQLQDDPDPQVLARILRRTARAGAVPARRAIQTLASISMGAITVVLAGWGIARTVDALAPSPSAPSVAPRTAPAQSSTTAPPTSLGSPPPTTSSCPPGPTGGPDVDGDRCGDDVRIDDDVVIVDGRRYRVGAPGDVIALGDWDCDGIATAAVLRPSTGSVHVFAAWAAPGQRASAVVLGTVDGATGIVASTECGPPRVSTTSGEIADVGATP